MTIAAPATNAPKDVDVPADAAARLPEPPPKPPVEDSIEPTVYRFILRHSLKQQIMLLILTLVSFPFLYYSLDLPKTIVNHAIKEDAKFPQYVFGFEFAAFPT